MEQNHHKFPFVSEVSFLLPHSHIHQTLDMLCFLHKNYQVAQRQKIQDHVAATCSSYQRRLEDLSSGLSSLDF